jgi:hypothetical protein
MRGAVHSGGFAGRGAIGHPAFGSMHSGFGSHTFSHFGSHTFSHGFGDRGFHHEFFRDGFRHRRCFGCRGFGFPWGYAGYGYYDPFWWDDFYADDYRFDEQQAREEALASEMDRFNIEEQRLRNREDAWDRQRDQDAYAGRDQDRYARGAQPQQLATSQPARATVLVFRDQHQQEVQNYAIADGTLWVLSAQYTKKIPLSELDLDATQKANDDRGVEFQMPR